MDKPTEPVLLPYDLTSSTFAPTPARYTAPLQPKDKTPKPSDELPGEEEAKIPPSGSIFNLLAAAGEKTGLLSKDSSLVIRGSTYKPPVPPLTKDIFEEEQIEIKETLGVVQPGKGKKAPAEVLKDGEEKVIGPGVYCIQ